MNGYPEIRLRIGGEWIARDGAPVISPSDESVIGHVPHARERDLDAAVESAEQGLRVWRATPAQERARIILKAHDIALSRAETISAAMSLEQGKPIPQSRLEILRGCEFLEWDAHEGRRLYGRVIPASPGLRHVVVKQPVGVVAAFSPWNFPFSSPSRKIGGALAAGCSLILKASEETPAAAFRLVEAFVDAGLPPGVLNLVYGDPPAISERLISDPRVRMVSFTGSPAGGQQVATVAARHLKPCLLELGGHGPVIVCKDADVDAVARMSAQSKARNSGQVCTAPTRFFVENEVFDRFVDGFAHAAKSLRLGSSDDESADMGPLIHRRRLEAIERMVEDALQRGARLVTGGRRQGERGFFYPLTILCEVPGQAIAMREEPFGPLALVNRVSNLDEAIEVANSLPYGLAAYAFTRSAEAIERLTERIEAGNLTINHFTASIAATPFGGVKGSGYGREGGTEGVSSYTVTKNVSVLVSP